MYLVKKPYEPIKNGMPKFRTLKAASFYCDENVRCEDLEIFKVIDGKLVDIYKLYYSSMFVVTTSYSSGRTYTYLKF